MKETIVLRSDNFCIVEGKDAPKPLYALETSLDFPFLKDLGNKDLHAYTLEKWHIIQKLGEGVPENYFNVPFIYENGRNTCAFCLIYNNWEHIFDEEGMCHGCPIFAVTSEEGCINTPYEKIAEWEYANQESFFDLVDKEIEFLESLEVE